MRMVSIASGSSGNAIYIGSDKTHILIDAGIAAKRIEEGLRTLGLSPGDLSAILITHEHIDHIRGLGVLLRKKNVPVYASGGTIEEIFKMQTLGRMDPELFYRIGKEEGFSIGDLFVKPFSVYHDAKEPYAYRVEKGEKAVAVATDTGCFDEEIVRHLEGTDAVLIEANHDIRMLETGPYPYALKRRILGDFGHLSNENAGRLLCRILSDKLKHVFLGHLSAENNYPELAYEAVRCEIRL